MSRSRSRPKASDEMPAVDLRKTEQRHDASDEEYVVCFFTGRKVPRSQAVQVRLGPGRKVWMLRVLCREG